MCGGWGPAAPCAGALQRVWPLEAVDVAQDLVAERQRAQHVGHLQAPLDGRARLRGRGVGPVVKQ